MANKLKPCPFCGAASQLEKSENAYDETDEREFYLIQCSYCLISTNWSTDKNEVINQWNMRYPEEPIPDYTIPESKL